MRQFTDAEKQQLQAKICDQQERRNLTVREIARRRDGKKPETPAWKYGFLGLIVCLVVFNVYILLDGDLSRYDQYSGLAFMLWLLFNHIADYFTKTGWQRRVMTAVARIWLVLTFVYGVCILSEISFPSMVGYLVLIIIFFVVWLDSHWRKICGKNSRYG